MVCAQQRGPVLTVQHITSFNSSSTCNRDTDAIISEVYQDLGLFGAQCTGTGRCSLNIADQTKNTVTRITDCVAAPQQAPQAMRTDQYVDAGCTVLHASFGYEPICFPGTLQGTDFGASTRYACDTLGNTFRLTYSTKACEANGVVACTKVQGGPAGGACGVSETSGFLHQRSFCNQPDANLPSLCYPGTTPPVTTQPPETLIPGDLYDLNRDGESNLLDIVYMMDHWGACPPSTTDVPPCEYADIRPLFGQVDLQDLAALWTHQANQ